MSQTLLATQRRVDALKAYVMGLPESPARDELYDLLTGPTGCRCDHGQGVSAEDLEALYKPWMITIGNRTVPRALNAGQVIAALACAEQHLPVLIHAPDGMRVITRIAQDYGQASLATRETDDRIRRGK